MAKRDWCVWRREDNGRWYMLREPDWVNPSHYPTRCDAVTRRDRNLAYYKSIGVGSQSYTLNDYRILPAGRRPKAKVKP